MNRKKLKALLLTCSVLVSLSAASVVSYAGTKTGPADYNGPLGYYSVGDLIKTNDFDDGIAQPWKIWANKPASADFNTENGKYNIKILHNSIDTYDLVVKHGGIHLEAGHTYTVTFDVTSDEDCKVYAKVGDESNPYGEYWNNNWTSFSIAKGETKNITQIFTMSQPKENCEFSFVLGGDYGAATCPYTVSIDNVHIYDNQFKGYPIEAPEPSNAIKVNQTGYYTDYEKTAVVNSTSSTPIEWRLLNNAGTIVEKGMTTVKETDNARSENLHLIDFSSCSYEGDNYKLEIDNSNIDSDKYDSNQSEPFSISNRDLYSNLKYDALKYFYLNRSGMDITMPYCGNSDFTRGGFFNLDRLGLQKGTWYDSHHTDYNLYVAGGWLESSYNKKYVDENSFAIWMLQNKYEKTFYYKNQNIPIKNDDMILDDSLLIPESGNEKPDILDEARYGLEPLLNMQVPDGQEYSGMVHNNIAADNSLTNNPEDHLVCYRKVTPPSTSATLELAAVAAQSARLWNIYDSDFSAKCLTAAEKAWDAAINHPDILAEQPNDVDNVSYTNNNIDDEFYWAACELYISTGEDKYLDYMKSSKYYLTIPSSIDNCDDSICGNFDAVNVEALGTLSLLSSPSYLPSSELKKAENNVLAAADELLKNQNENVYGSPIKESYLKDIDKSGYAYNSNLYNTNAAIVLSYAYDISWKSNNVNFDKYFNGALNTLDYLLGKNPNNKSYVTGYGLNDVKNPYYDMKMGNSIPSGWMVSGPDSKDEDSVLKSFGYNLENTEAANCYIDNKDSWSTNKVSLSNNASFAWLVSFIDENKQRYIPPMPPILLGDVNHDRKVNIKDYILIQKYLLNNDTSIYTTEADIDRDGNITVTDALLLKKYLMSN